jgi:hypothetical protein
MIYDPFLATVIGSCYLPCAALLPPLVNATDPNPTHYELTINTFREKRIPKIALNQNFTFCHPTLQTPANARVVRQGGIIIPQLERLSSAHLGSVKKYWSMVNL